MGRAVVDGSEGGGRAPIAIIGCFRTDDLYQRNRILIEILRASTPEIRNLGGSVSPRIEGLSFRLGLWSRAKQLCCELRVLFTQRARLSVRENVFVPYPPYLALLIMKMTRATRGRLVVADAFIELESTVVEDRGLLPRGSFRARCLGLFQRVALGSADVVLIDTTQQAQLLRKSLSGLGVCIVDLPVGIDEQKWFALPAPTVGVPLHIAFWGTFIPLHGIPVIIEAARVLEMRGMSFTLSLVGDGQTADTIAADLLTRPVESLRWERRLVSTEALRDLAGRAHVVLGIFGESLKAAGVVPYKVCQALAMNRPVITRSSPAMEPLADSEYGLLTVPAGDPVALADALQDVAGRIATGWVPATRGIYDVHLSNARVAEKLLAAFEDA